MNIILWIVVIAGGAIGALSSLYCIISIPTILIFKIYRKIRYGISLND